MDFNQRVITLLQLPVSPLTWDSLLKECDRLETDFLHIPSGYKWTLDYKRFQVEQARGNNSQAIWHLKSAIAAMPYNGDILGDYKELVKKTSGIKNLVLIITSKKNEAKALRLAAQFDQANIEYMIVSGADTSSIEHVRALQVDISDRYEAIPQKVAAAFTWVYENIGNNVGVLKVDDEMMLQDADKLRQSLDQLVRENVYAGVPSASLEHDRCMHWGLCLDQDLNRRVYGRPVLRAWASGGAYYLGPKPLEKVVLSLLRFPGLFEGEYYEDKLIGDVLVFEGEALNERKGYADFGLTLPGAAPAPLAENKAVPPAPGLTIPVAAPVSAPIPEPVSASQKNSNALKISEWNSR
ncbi:hypothetical protein [Herbaspirillum sp. RV1423]|uniref:hypothetical protein n=1 Tax=Herbaspirillum sp. RV1423 TaxID=1443993 RepID=UPI0012DE3C2D|nr:hypothetical protein [Herbaspirillum sp. RV1423]